MAEKSTFINDVSNGEKPVDSLTDDEVIESFLELNPYKLKSLITRLIPDDFACDIKRIVRACEIITYEYPKGVPRYWKWKRPVENGNAQPNTMEYVRKIMPHITKLRNILISEGALAQPTAFYVDGDKEIKKIFASLLEQFDPLIIANPADYAEDLCGLFKSYIAQIPEPLLTEIRFTDYANLTQHFQNMKIQSKHHTILRSVQLFLLLLPTEYRQLLRLIIDVLHKVIEIQGAEKASHLARIFVIHLVCPRSMPAEAVAHVVSRLHEPMEFMILHGERIFDPPSDLMKELREQLQILRDKRQFDWKPTLSLNMDHSDTNRSPQNGLRHRLLRLATVFK